jgi:diaminopimelate epimerase
MPLRFAKMQGLGNDFVVIDGIRQTVALTAGQIQAIADRHFGIGCDQLLLVEPSSDPRVDFRYRIFNADGEEVEQCGNGARCFARFVRDEGLSERDTLRVETRAGVIELMLEGAEQVTVNMGCPRLEPAAIPFLAAEQATRYPIRVADDEWEIGAVSMGNPHAVVQVRDIDEAPLATLGPLLESHARFPRRTNVGFMQVLRPDRIRLRVYERGVGETLACGTGACAAVVVGSVQGLLRDTVAVELPGGTLTIHWAGGNTPVSMTGPARRVFDGWLDPDKLAR